ncbi:hypothetical protein M3Y98_00871100 [Aphelenchoides besseyi]|nr:hypothetical protein M3Y98_00871100 [Aphelenchoides besseyi]KAI6211287.1 hypothetical protein M3Y96_00417500 [Aphelenchoides besseyi]
MFATITKYSDNELNGSPAGPYTEANDEEHGRVIRTERVEHVYRISGAGRIPSIDPSDPSLVSTFEKCAEDNGSVPKIKLISRQLKLEEKMPPPRIVQETSPPHTTLTKCEETTIKPEEVSTTVDQRGIVFTKTVNNEQIKHTVQKQTYQTFVVDDTQTEQPSAKNNLERLIQSVIPITSIIPTDLHSERARTYVLVYGKDAERPPRNDEQFGEDSVMSTNLIEKENRTIETITYKTLRNGKVHTTLEHRITINGPEAIHASELKIAISEATATNPNFEVVSVEIKEERLP